ncbi:MAG: hypothetical protein ACXWZF_05040 [Actinomycetota bacterium]
MTNATDATEAVVEASLSAFEFREAAWRADERGRGVPETSTLSDPALLAVMQYERADLPPSASTAVRDEATRRGLIASLVDRWLPWAVLGLLVLSGVAIVGGLFMA